MKKYLSLIICFVLVLTLIPSFSAVADAEETSGKAGWGSTWKLNGTTLTISGVGFVDGYFSNAPWGYDIKEVIIGEGITHLGYMLFYNCTALEKVTLPSTLEYMDDCIFGNCTSLKSINLPDGLLSVSIGVFNGSGIEYNEYGGAYYLGNTENPYLVLLSVKSKDITSCTVHEDTKVIGKSAFAGCENLKNITLSDSVVSVGSSAFMDCYALESLTLSDNLTYLERYATVDISITSYNEYENVKYLGSKNNPYLIAMAPTSQNVTSLKIHKDTKFIADGAFMGCNSLESCELPEGLLYIGSNAFYFCPLKSIVLPESLNDTGMYPFSTVEDYNVSDGLRYLGSKNNPYFALLRPDESKDLYDTVTVNKATEIIISDAFFEAMITNLYISNSVKHPITDADSIYAQNVYFDGTAEELAAIARYPFFDKVNYIHEHTYDGDCDAYCNICNEERMVTASHTFTAWSGDFEEHWHECSVCKAVFDKAEHTDEDGNEKCDICLHKLVDESTFEDGWYEDADGKFYIKDGERVKGVVTINKRTYFFDEDGVQSVGFKCYEGKYYYFNDFKYGGYLYKGQILHDGKIYNTSVLGYANDYEGWHGNKEYYVKNGDTVKGLQKIDGLTYYFGENGIKSTGFKNIDGTPYYFVAPSYGGYAYTGKVLHGGKVYDVKGL